MTRQRSLGRAKSGILPPSSLAPSRPGEEERGEGATDEVIGQAGLAPAAGEVGTPLLGGADGPLREGGATLPEKGGSSDESVEDKTLSPGRVGEEDWGSVALASPAVVETIEIVVGAGSATVDVGGEGGAGAPWRRRAAVDDARGGSKRRRLSFPLEEGRGDIGVEEGEGGAARGDEAIVIAPTTADVGVEEDDVVGPPGWAEESVEPLPAEVTIGEGEGGDAASESSLESLPLGGEVSP